MKWSTYLQTDGRADGYSELLKKPMFKNNVSEVVLPYWNDKTLGIVYQKTFLIQPSNIVGKKVSGLEGRPGGREG